MLGEDTARLVTRFLADPMARLPSFPRYGDSEFPFTVALKTGTSQGYRDAWTIAWSREFLLGVWVGRADAGPMRGLTGGRAAARIANAMLLRLHGVGRSDLTAGEFAAPAGLAAREVCTDSGREEEGCPGRLLEFVGPARPKPVEATRLDIVAPEANARFWRNPEVPAAANRLALKVRAPAGVTQVVWLVDGDPVGTSDPARPFYWALSQGVHHVQARLPFAVAGSASVRIVVE